MSDKIDWIDSWEIRPRPDGSFGVYDHHGMVAGPFGLKDQAIKAAMALPRPTAPYRVSRREEPTLTVVRSAER